MFHKRIRTSIAAVLWLASAGALAGGSVGAKKSSDEIVRDFHKLWYEAQANTWDSTRWMGIPTEQNPMDVWITQEIIFDVKPDVVVECGAYRGGSAALWAMILSQVNPNGHVISIDIVDKMREARRLPIVQKYVTFLIGSSTAPEVVAEVKKRTRGKKALVILDSDHAQAHVAKELDAYAPIVPVGGYLIVQDTNVNGHPVSPTFGPGPREAVDAFLAKNKSFKAVRRHERLMFTFNERGFLKRIRP
jgi:cephalosporin hydroxylase